MDKLVEIKNLDMYYPIQNETSFAGKANAFLHALNGINLEIYKGEILGNPLAAKAKPAEGGKKNVNAKKS